MGGRMLFMRLARGMLRWLVVPVMVGVLFGALATGAGVWWACRNKSHAVSNQATVLAFTGEQGARGIALVIETKDFVRVSLDLNQPGTSGLGMEALSLKNLHALVVEARQPPPMLSTREYAIRRFMPEHEPVSPERHYRGLSEPQNTESPKWMETAWGRPFRCLRVRGPMVSSGPLTRSSIPTRWGGIAGWSIAWGEAAKSIAVFGTPAAVLAVPIQWAGAWLRRRHRRKHGCCIACGYDLRGVPAGWGCPECGLSEPEARARTRRERSTKERPA